MARRKGSQHRNKLSSSQSAALNVALTDPAASVPALAERYGVTTASVYQRRTKLRGKDYLSRAMKRATRRGRQTTAGHPVPSEPTTTAALEPVACKACGKVVGFARKSSPLVCVACTASMGERFLARYGA